MLAEKYDFKGWYVRIEDGVISIEYGPLSKSAANRKYKLLRKLIRSPIWCVSGREMQRELVAEAELKAGWSVQP